MTEKVINYDGVMAIIYNESGKILLLREQSDKARTKRRNGDIGVVCETREEGELDPLTTLRRGLREELSLEEGQLEECFDWQNNAFLGCYKFVEGVKAAVYALECRTPDLVDARNGSAETQVIGWNSLVQLENLQIRVGVRNVMDQLGDNSNFLALKLNRKD